MCQDPSALLCVLFGKGHKDWTLKYFFALLPTVFMFNAATNESKNVNVQLLLKVPSFIYIHLTKFSINFLTIQFRFTQHCLDTLMQDK